MATGSQSHPFDRYASFTDVAALKEFSGRSLRKSKRINTLKSSIDAFKVWAAEKQWKLEPVSWCPEAFFIDREDRTSALGKDLMHLLGHTYMQEAASMLPPELLDVQPGETVLDMSAAPGSKSTQLAARMKNTGVLVTNDVQEKRLWTLKAALHRAGVTNYVVTKKVGQWFAKHMTERFDRVLCDAPCTAQGTARKDSDALMYCSMENIGKMAKLQRELLEAAVHAVKVGGTVVYSTCTLTPEENEDVIRSLLEKFPGQLECVDPRTLHPRFASLDRAIAASLLVQEKENMGTTMPLVRLWPHEYDTEGFFCAVLRKTAHTRQKEHMDWVRYQEDLLPRIRTRDIGNTVESLYGASFIRDGECLFERGKELLLSTEAVADFKLTVENYSLGLPFALRLDGSRVRVHHEIMTLRGAEATKHSAPINESQLQELLDGRDTKCDPALDGDTLLIYRGIPIGFGLAREGILKNRLPRWIVQKS